MIPFVALLIFLSPATISKEALSLFVVWNVGQGQWLTSVSLEECSHFDAGGEKIPLRRIRDLCQKSNRFHFTHWDLDHLGGIAKWSRKNSCIASAPPGPAPSYAKARMILDKIPCEFRSSISRFSFHGKASNENSHAYQFRQFLIPGDLPSRQEPALIPKLNKSSARVLILGHHGSRTSTSAALLQSLPNLQQAVSSARFDRFRHPHWQTLQRLKNKKIPQLRTEDWGNIFFEIQ